MAKTPRTLPADSVRKGWWSWSLENPDATKWRVITWLPPKLSNSFHGRDLFAPVAAQLALAHLPASEALDPRQCIDTAWPEELARIVYIDAFGNAMTGIRAKALDARAKLVIHGCTLSWARTFSEVPPQSGFWYENSNGLVEIAVNQGRAEGVFNLRLGDAVFIEHQQVK